MRLTLNFLRTYHRLLPALLFLGLSVALFFSAFACSPGSKSDRTEQKAVNTNAFHNWQIEKNGVGPIRLGISMTDVQEYLKGFERVEIDPMLYGYDGGGMAYEYYLNNEPVLAIIPYRDNDTILALVAIHPALKTANGLGTNSTVEDIVKLHPYCTVNLILMSDDEHIFIKSTGVDFVFRTEDSDRIGTYSIPDVTESLPENTGKKTDHILI